MKHTVGVCNIYECAKPILRHEGECATGKLDPVNILTPVFQEFFKVCFRHRSIIRATNLSETFGACCLRFQRVGR